MAPGGRPRSFDDDEVVERAGDLFWRRGYKGTSMRDLGDALGVLPGSLHAAFGSKYDLFVRALHSYADLSTRSVSTVLEEGPVLPQLRQLLMGVLAAAVSTPGRGCMLGNSAAELAPDNEEARDIVRNAFDELETAISRALERGKESGEISPGIESDAEAVLLVALMQGVHILARVAQNPMRLETAVDAAIAPLKR